MSFSELSTAANTGTKEVIMPSTAKPGKQETSKGSGSRGTGGGQKENWEELSERVENKRKELNMKKGSGLAREKRDRDQNKLLIR